MDIMEAKTMKTNVIRSAIFALLCLFAWATPLAAEHLVFIQRWESLHMQTYVDIDSVVRHGDTLYYSHVEVFDRTDIDSISKKEVKRTEVNLAVNPQKFRYVIIDCYDSDGRQVSHDASASAFYQVDSGTRKEIDVALKYAK